MDLRRSVAEHLQVSRDRKSYTVRLGFWSEDPAKAAALSAALLAAYLDAQRARKRAGLSWLTDWLRERASTLTARYDATRRTLDERLAQDGLLDTGAQVELDQRLQVLAVEAAQARGRLVEAMARSQGLGALKEAGLLDQAPEILASPVILKLKDGLAAAISRTAVWSTETTAIERQIAIESGRIVASAAVEVRSWEKARGDAQGAGGRDPAVDRAAPRRRAVGGRAPAHGRRRTRSDGRGSRQAEGHDRPDAGRRAGRYGDRRAGGRLGCVLPKADPDSARRPGHGHPGRVRGVVAGGARPGRKDRSSMSIALPNAVPRAVRNIFAGPAWLGHPSAYTIGSPLLSLMGAGTMIVAPGLLAPAAFGVCSRC